MIFWKILQSPSVFARLLLLQQGVVSPLK